MDIFTYLKNVGGGLATVTTLAYASGYLALRARAYTLGTDPYLNLVYEGYVFAGFRFVFISLIILLILSPILALIRWGAHRISKQMPGSWLDSGQWMLLVLLVFGTICITSKFFSVKHVLLLHGKGKPNSFIEEAVMGEPIAFALMLAMMVATSLSVLWLKERLTSPTQSFTWILGSTVALQLFLLPAIYGSV